MIEASPRELTSFLTSSRAAHARSSTPSTPATTPRRPSKRSRRCSTIGPLLDQQAQLVAVSGGRPAARRRPVAAATAGEFRSGLLDHITPEAAHEPRRARRAPILQIRPVGGAVNDVDPQATAYAHRTQNFAVSAVGGHASNARWDAEVVPHMNGLYISFDTDLRPERLHDAFPGETLERLRALKAVYDPDNVFNQNFPIAPAMPILGR